MDIYRAFSIIIFIYCLGEIYLSYPIPSGYLLMCGYVLIMLFIAANYWCGFPFRGWWKRNNIWF